MADPRGRQGSGSHLNLWELAGELGFSWKSIGRQLGYSEGRLEGLLQDYQNQSEERAYQMLLRWIRRTNARGTPSVAEQLRQALRRAQRMDLADYVTDDTMTIPSVPRRGVSPNSNSAFDKEVLSRKLKNFVSLKMSELPLVPWMTVRYINVDQVFTNVELLISTFSAYFPVRLPLKSHNAIFRELTVEGGSTDQCGTRVLLRGRTGSGKTTLLTKYAWDWSTDKEGALLMGVPVVFVLPMRKLDHRSNLGQAVLDHMLPNEKRISASDIEQFCEDHPHDVVILLDGYDEFKGKGLDHEDCGNIVEMLRGEWLTECRVVVTTRPARVDDFRPDYGSYRQIEITGFTPKDIENYVHKVFSGEKKSLGDRLLIYLEENNLKELASIPLMLTAFCQLTKWTDGKDFAELNTISKLFDRLIECMFIHDKIKPVKKRTSLGAAVTPVLRSFEPKVLVLELGKVGLEGFLGKDKEELTFSKEDFCRCSQPVEVIMQGLQVGLLTREGDSSVQPQTYEELGLEGQGNSTKRDISFVLKSIQEKCAGKYLANLLECDEEERFTTYLQKIDSEQRVLDYINILVFASAANEKASRCILSHVIDILRRMQGQNITQFLRGKLHFEHCPKTQRLVETCLQLNFESKGDGRFNDLFNSLFGDSRCVRLVGISSYVAKALGYLFTHSYQHCQDLTASSGLDERRCPLSVDRLQLIYIKLESSSQFREFLNCFPGTEEEIIKFMGKSVKQEIEGGCASVTQLLKTSERPLPSYLGNRPDLTVVAVAPIWQEVNKHQVQDFNLGFILSGLKMCSLEEVVLNGVNAEPKHWNELFEMIKTGKFGKVTRLTLTLNDLTFEQTSELATALGSGKAESLQFLKLAGNKLGEGFVNNLRSLPKLENVILDKSEMTSKAMVEFTTKLQQYPCLKKLDLRRNENTDDQVIYSMCDTLKNRKSWKELRLSLYQVSEAGLDSLQGSMGLAEGLTHVNLVHSPIPDKVIQYCAKGLDSLPKLEDLRISGIPSTSQEGTPCTHQTVRTFTTEMTKLRRLRFLSFLYTKMSSQDFIKMLNCCRDHSSLKTFRFSRPYLPSGDDVEQASKEAEQEFLQLWV